jgi:hypothetical protein
MPDPLVDTHLMLGSAQRRRLRLLAADRQTSIAALARDAIDHYLSVVVGPDPRRLRLAARDAAGLLPPSPRREDDGGLDRAVGGWSA